MVRKFFDGQEKLFLIRKKIVFDCLSIFNS